LCHPRKGRAPSTALVDCGCCVNRKREKQLKALSSHHSEQPSERARTDQACHRPGARGAAACAAPAWPAKKTDTSWLQSKRRLLWSARDLTASLCLFRLCRVVRGLAELLLSLPPRLRSPGTRKRRPIRRAAPRGSGGGPLSGAPGLLVGVFGTAARRSGGGLGWNGAGEVGGWGLGVGGRGDEGRGK